MKSRSTRYFLALQLHLVMVGVVLCGLLVGFGDSMAIRWNQVEQQQVINQLPTNHTQCVILHVSTLEFDKIQIREGKECVLNGEFYDVAAIRHENGGLTLTLLPDHKETALQKNVLQRLAGAQPFHQAQKIPFSGFLFFETWQMPPLRDFSVKGSRPIPYCRCMTTAFQGTSRPPPRHLVT